MCDGKTHNLEVIDTYDVGWDTYHVVRWCIDCGSIVVDKEIDGRLDPGGSVKMKFPKSALKEKI